MQRRESREMGSRTRVEEKRHAIEADQSEIDIVDRWKREWQGVGGIVIDAQAETWTRRLLACSRSGLPRRHRRATAVALHWQRTWRVLRDTVLDQGPQEMLQVQDGEIRGRRPR